MLQHQTHCKQGCTHQERLQVFRLLAAVLVTVVMAVVVMMLVFMAVVVTIIVMIVTIVMVFVIVAAAAVMMMLMLAAVAVCAVSGVELHTRLHLLCDLLKLGQQSVGVFGGDPKLHRGVGQHCLLYLGECAQRRFHLRRAVGAVQILYQIYFLHHGNASLIKCIYEHTLIY